MKRLKLVSSLNLCHANFGLLFSSLSASIGISVSFMLKWVFTTLLQYQCCFGKVCLSVLLQQALVCHRQFIQICKRGLKNEVQTLLQKPSA